MTHAEQHRIILELRDYMHRMNRDDGELFEMMLKRDKDDEDLDDISWKRLRTMYETYVPEKKRLL